MLTNKLKFKTDIAEYLKNAFLHPVPRLAEGQLLVKHGVKTAIDISDGLLSDLRHIGESSQVSARVEVESLPVHPFVKGSFGEKARGLALSGGEDYELLFTGSAAAINRVKAEIKCPVTVIGEITAGEPGKIELCDAFGKVIKIARTGWQHF
jgi:thiamine-monophosphate kinase